jgi:hypothetical protein
MRVLEWVPECPDRGIPAGTTFQPSGSTYGAWIVAGTSPGTNPPKPLFTRL